MELMMFDSNTCEDKCVKLVQFNSDFLVNEGQKVQSLFDFYSVDS